MKVFLKLSITASVDMMNAKMLIHHHMQLLFGNVYAGLYCDVCSFDTFESFNEIIIGVLDCDLDYFLQTIPTITTFNSNHVVFTTLSTASTLLAFC